MTLMEAATFRQPRLLLETPAKLRIAREEAARAELDPAPEQWWRVRLAGLCAVVAGAAGPVVLSSDGVVGLPRQ